MSNVINLEKINNKKNKNKKIVTFIFVFIIIYIISTIFILTKNTTESYMVEIGTITSDETTTGYIIRDENIIKGKNYKNGIYQIALEGERVAKNQTIYRYYGTDEEKLKTQIEEIDDKLQIALENQNNIFSTDIKNLEKQINTKLKLLKNETDLQNITEYKKQITELLTKKAKIVGELSPTGSYIKELTNQRDELENELLKSSEYIKAPESGIVSYKVDELEEVLTTNDFSTLTEETLEKLDLKTGKIVSTNNECAKIINNFECYIATFLDSQIAYEIEEGESVTLTLTSGNEIQAEIVNKYEKENGKMLIIFKINTLTDELISYRKISFNITWWSKTGMKIQNSSIIEQDGLKYVIGKKSGNYYKLLIKELKRNDKYSIISTYSNEELEKMNIDKSKYVEIGTYDTILIYPNIDKLKLIN